MENSQQPGRPRQDGPSQASPSQASPSQASPSQAGAHRPSRRSVLKGAGAGLAAAAAGIALSDGITTPAARARSVTYAIPSGGTPHTCTFMAWPYNPNFWELGGGITLAGAQHDIANLAQTIARYEPVIMIATADQLTKAQQAVGSAVTVIPIGNNDLWVRDMGPTFVVGTDGSLAAVDTNFNGWGDKQKPHNLDARVTTNLCRYYGITRIDAPLVTEGGALEPDGNGTLMATLSSIVNSNRNPGKSQATITAELESTLGLGEVIWFKGVKHADITDDHVDALARFTDIPGIVLVDLPPAVTPPWSGVTAQCLQVLSTARDARGSRLQAVAIPEPDYTKIRFQGDQSQFLGSYVNYYVCNGAVITPQFGDGQADGNAHDILQQYFPDRDVVMIDYDIVSANGGGVHCSTQQQPSTGG